MAYNETVNIKVNADTSGVDNLEESLSKQENRIKTLDGAINVLGGSVEILAGGLTLTGALSDEQAEKFEGAAIGAIALADGAKRVMDGYKSLSESTKILTFVQRIYNTVMNANPVFVIVGVLAAVTTGVIALTRALKSQREEQEKLNEVTDQANATNEYYDRIIALAQARGESQISILFKQQIAQDKRLKGLQKEQEALEAIAKPTEDQIKRLEELPQLIKDAELAAEIAEIKYEKESERLRTEREKKEKEERDARAAAIKERQDNDIVQLKAKSLDEIQIVKDTEDQKLELVFSAQDRITYKQQEEARKRQEIAKAEEEYKQLLLTDGIDNIQGALGALFGENKAVASANVLIDAAQAGVGIIKNSQTTGPFAIAYQASQFALLGATTIAALRDINSAEPGTSGSPNVPGGGGGRPLSATGAPSGIPAIPGFGTSGVTALNAVVLSGDVTSAQAQDAAIRSRRRFGRGG